MKKFSFLLVLVMFLAALAIAVPARADLVLVTNRATLGSDTVNWAQFGSAGTSVPDGSIAVSVPSDIATQVSGDDLSVYYEGSPGWSGNFQTGDAVLYNYGAGPLRLGFATGVYGAGAQIQPASILGSFMARVEAFGSSGSLGYFTVTGFSSQGHDNTAVFLGISSTTPISFLTFSLADLEGFGINQLALNPNPVPLPPSAYLLGIGLALMVYGQRRRK